MRWPWFYMLCVDCTCLICGTWLVMNEHYGWAWIPFVLAGTTNFKQRAD